MTCNICDEMAERPKRTLRQPIRFAEEYCVPSSKRCKKPTTDNNLYEIEVNRDRNLVRIHYKGYSENNPVGYIYHFLVYITNNPVGYIYHFLVYITGSVIKKHFLVYITGLAI